ncbi:hypothetical protein [Streptomyces pristinaespiralis]|uniref:hypothetical protein n=1 Tax=Streptomyces pristinaespiralis TaxID=38300 RepID=UPI0038369BDC
MDAGQCVEKVGLGGAEVRGSLGACAEVAAIGHMIIVRAGRRACFRNSQMYDGRSLPFAAVCMRLQGGEMTTRPWLTVLAYVLVIVGSTMFFVNAEALLNGDAVECDGSPMRPGQWCASFSGGESFSYDEEKENEAWGEIVGYAGVGLGALGIALFTSLWITTRRRNR